MGSHPSRVQSGGLAGGARNRRPDSAGVRHPSHRDNRAETSRHRKCLVIDRRNRVDGPDSEYSESGKEPALLHQRRCRHRRILEIAAPLLGPEADASVEQSKDPPRVGAPDSRVDVGSGLYRRRDAHLGQRNTRRRAGVPGAEPTTPRPFLRPTSVTAAVQTDVDGRRDRPLLSDRALLPRRGPARRPRIGVHAA